MKMDVAVVGCEVLAADLGMIVMSEGRNVACDTHDRAPGALEHWPHRQKV